MKTVIIEGFEIKDEWIKNSNYPEPPDTHFADLSQENIKIWDSYRKEVEKFYNKCVEKCTCNEFDKNHNICHICDENKYNKINGLFNKLTK